MKKTLKSQSWKDTALKIRNCHLSLLNDTVSTKAWNLAFDALIDSIHNERMVDPTFATEIYNLTSDTGFSYDIKDILEEYFDVMEENKQYDSVIRASNVILNTFAWNNVKPSQYNYRIGNALLQLGKLDEAEKFGQKWLSEDPDDPYAIVSNAFLLMKIGKKEEARALANKILDGNTRCDDDTQAVFMAVTTLFEQTKDVAAKRRVEQKIAEYNKMMGID